MENQKNNINRKEYQNNLREIAEKKLQESGKQFSSVSEKQINDIVHELQVHQIELEMQNDELKKSEIALAESREKYMELYDFAPIGYLTLSNDALIKEANLTIEELFEVERKRLINTRFRRYIFKEDLNEWDIFFTNISPDEKPKNIEIRITKFDGNIFFASIEGKRIINSSSADLRLLTIKDISEQKRIEKELKLSESNLKELNYEKDKFFSIIAHDLRSPISGYIGITEILKENIQDMSVDDLKDISGKMYTSANTMYLLLSNLLEWALIQRGLTNIKPITTSLKKLVEKCVESEINLFNQKKIKCEINTPENLNIFADVQMTETVIRNLLTNAIKFSNLNSIISISAKELGDKMVVICVNDSGIGMSKEFQNKLFHLDEDVKRPGTIDEPSTGLGLLLCKELIEKNGGKISVESIEGKGSRICFSLPRIPKDK